MSTEIVKKHGNIGNNNAKKDVVNDAQIYIRCTTDFKNMLVKAAQKDNKKLSNWVMEKLNKIMLEEKE
ncbi:hypothetical protein [Providencia stuartii]|uniref:hypothetical protein n=1 Tax=Providencia stuartii TaxID=588 RepID=UPI0024B22933